MSAMAHAPLFAPLSVSMHLPLTPPALRTFSPWIVEADRLAEERHRGQVRKYTEAPYISHPREVATLVGAVPHTIEMLQAALLHDTVEDTTNGEAEQRELLALIHARFGGVVAQSVAWLTDQIPLSFGPRKARKLEATIRLSQAPASVQTIKLADRLSNVHSILTHDRGFAPVYVTESRDLLERLTAADSGLRAALARLLAQAEASPHRPSSPAARVWRDPHFG